MSPQQEAKNLLKKLDIHSVPTPLDEISDKLGLKVLPKDLEDEHCGFIYADGNEVIIGINSSHGENRQRFTWAHEIAHFVLHKKFIMGHVHLDRKFDQKLRGDKRSISIKDYKEIEANKFAAELLMPADKIKKDIRDYIIDIQEDDEWQQLINDLAKNYKVSTQSMSIKLSQILYKDI